MDGALPALSLTEWAVLGFIDEGETYGFSLSKYFTPGESAGKVWTVPRPLVYRAIDALEAAGFVVPVGSEPGAGGPRRTLVRTTPHGSEALARWLDEPIEHVRDARSHLLVKLLLIERRHGSAAVLARRQRTTIAGIADGLRAQLAGADGFDITLLRWRLDTVEMLDRFLEEIEHVE